MPYSHLVVAHLRKIIAYLIVYSINDYMTKPIPRFRGPSLILLATVHILLFVAGLVAAATLRHGALYVTPFASAEDLRSFFAKSPTAVRVSNFFLFGSAVPFGIFAVTIVSRLRFMGVRAAGTNIALLGGLTATIALLLSGVTGWVLSVPEVSASAPVVKAVDFLSFLLGGVSFRGGLRFAGCGSIGHKLLHAASSAVAGSTWNASCHNRRTLLVQPHRISGKLFHSHYQIRGLHLDGLCRCSTDEKSEDSASRLYRRVLIDCGTLCSCESSKEGKRVALCRRYSETRFGTQRAKTRSRTQLTEFRRRYGSGSASGRAL